MRTLTEPIPGAAVAPTAPHKMAPMDTPLQRFSLFTPTQCKIVQNVFLKVCVSTLCTLLFFVSDISNITNMPGRAVGCGAVSIV